MGAGSVTAPAGATLTASSNPTTADANRPPPRGRGRQQWLGQLTIRAALTGE
jgi:hypothetical protein